MTLFLSFRTHNSVGGLDDGQAFTASADSTNLQNLSRDLNILISAAQGRDVLFATHGFNVSQKNGIRTLSWLERALDLSTATTCFIGVLWPGDSWLGPVNYPIEPTDAVRCGKRLGAVIDKHFKGANSISFVSHSLGARVVLQAATSTARTTNQLCVTAAAVNSDALTRQYDIARAASARVSVLSSTKDKVLRLAYPLGEAVSDTILLRGENRLHGALGLNGPKPDKPIAPGIRHTPIPATPATDITANFTHSDYFPNASPTGGARADTVARYIRSVFLGAATPDWR